MSIAERAMALDHIDQETSKPILSSTGRLGVSRRPDERLYVNGPRFSSDPTEVDRNLRRLMSIGERHEEKVGRTIFRGLVSPEVMRHISTSDLSRFLEVALPVGEFTDDTSWLISMARNRKGRELIVPLESMIREISSMEGKEVTPPVEKVKAVVDQGYTFTNEIREEDIDQVYALWGETFGWKKEEIVNLARRLETGKLQHPSKKDVWFSAIKNEGRIISVAMAERLSVPGANKMLDLVESTEWSIDKDHAGNGVMTANLDMLNAQILSDLRSDPNRFPPLIFAECNYQSRADRVGRGAGLRVPDRTHAPQILAQNVLIRDGQPVEKSKKRDFTFMYLPVDAINGHYSSSQTDRMVQLIKSN